MSTVKDGGIAHMRARMERLGWDAIGRSSWPTESQCERLEPLAGEPPYGRDAMQAWGLSGLQFGAGNRRHASCLNADLLPITDGNDETELGRVYLVDGAHHVIRVDARHPLPFLRASFDWMYSEHLIEHLTLPEGIRWLREVRRVLAPGSLARITTPDLRRYVEGYLDPDDAFYARHRQHVEEIGFPPMAGRKAFMLNQIFQFFGHQWVYDADELRHALVQAGFRAGSIQVRSFRDGRIPLVAGLDDTHRSDESIYIEATV